MVSSNNLTIVMSVFNECNNVSLSIESIINQSYTSWNFIIIDDASTDDTKKIIQSYAKKYTQIQLLTNKSNLGLACSLNKAIKNCSSRYIARMDADDISLPQRIEKQMNFLDLHPEIDVLGTGAYITTPQSKIKIKTLKPNNHQDISGCIEKLNPFFHTSVIMKMDFFNRMGGYDCSFYRAQDYDLWFRGVDNSNYHNLPEALVYYESRNQTIKSIFYGFKVRVVNSIRRRRVLRGMFIATMVIAYGLTLKFKRFIFKR